MVKNLKGETFGLLTVIKETDKKGFWLCECQCGNTTIVRRSQLISGKTKSCGCLKKKTRLLSGFNESVSNTRLYKIWSEMKIRCYNPKNKSYPRYGGRGIRVCDEWLNSYKAFYDWAISHGYGDELSIDRKDVNGNYEPNNCRWVDDFIQSRNKRNSNTYTYNGQTLCMVDWASFFDINYSSLLKSIKRGHTFEETISSLRKIKNKGNEEVLKPCPYCAKRVAVLSCAKELEECKYFDKEGEDICPNFEWFAPPCKKIRVVCDFTKGGCGATSGYAGTIEEAIRKWNMRT